MYELYQENTVYTQNVIHGELSKAKKCIFHFAVDEEIKYNLVIL